MHLSVQREAAIQLVEQNTTDVFIAGYADAGD